MLRVKGWRAALALVWSAAREELGWAAVGIGGALVRAGRRLAGSRA